MEIKAKKEDLLRWTKTCFAGRRKTKAALFFADGPSIVFFFCHPLGLVRWYKKEKYKFIYINLLGLEMEEEDEAVLSHCPPTAKLDI